MDRLSATKLFLFPGLQGLGYESGCALRLDPALRACPDLTAEVLEFRGGQLAATHTIILPAVPAPFVRAWASEWSRSAAADTSGTNDVLYALRLRSSSNPRLVLPQREAEAQMLFRNGAGWNSSILTGFVPARAAGYRFAPIIHTAYCVADHSTTETVNLFMNVRDAQADSPKAAGALIAHPFARDGTPLGSCEFPVLGNATLAISNDDIGRRSGIDPAVLRAGINIKFTGGASQFSILTLFRHRSNGSIGLEHSLAPLYYIPELKSPAVRSLVYGELATGS